MANGLAGLKALTSSNLLGLGQYFNLPTIGGLYSKPFEVKSTGINKKIDTMILNLFDIFKFGIPLYPDVYEESGSNDVSEQVLIGGLGSDTQIEGLPGDDIAGALIKVADNIVVNPRKWRIHGYTGLNLNTKIGQVINGLIPEATLQSFISKFGRDTLNSLFKQTLQYLSEARRPFKFNTREGETVPCLIRSYTVKTVAENNNFVELDLELQEFRFLALTESGEQKPVGGVNSNFNAKNLGRTALRALVF
jgi:hypothetical protein